MSKRPPSKNMFWARHIGLALAIIVAAIIVINLEQLQDALPMPKKSTEPKKNPAKGLSDFYAQYRSPTNEVGGDSNDFVVDLNTDDASLNERLQSMESLQKPASGRWVGEHKYRTFKAGSTLREMVAEYAQREGMQLIWELDQDFVVKSNFQVEDTIVGTVNQVARAIDSNFNGTVEAFFCPKQRTLVVTNNPTDYLRKNCHATDPKISALQVPEF
ncbi:toxin co-regulated pilus biosynthesis Q family protein [Aliiglaciecola sp. CAU 1673]|uniref:toxin co-regulated pilus biosynthesis Q family protein n=1 Tax=Aliiglaciecola sp. CAU 1673 TaxID=3032595 RepID=UPI0023DBDE6A|nr:toxin co-regulated pilus biosynthesis Q family protein [Aliiglaciecola sp. CAU 1673]MDF2180039.1 toxin co-regulated pilus biosynthesis Q family protein [Aliiglaciecola sp. CAU 1673]